MSVSQGTASPHPLEPLRRALRVALVGAGLLLGLSVPVGWVVDGSAGAVGALLGVAVPAAFFAITVVTALVTLRLSPGALGGVVLGSWVVKLVLLIVAMSLLNQWDGWSRPVFGVTFVVAVIGWLVLEAWVVVRTRAPYVQPTTAATPAPDPDAPGAPGPSTRVPGSVDRLPRSHDGHA